jgi:short-subunit dehydrogenase
MSWSQAVHQENLETGVRVACVVPGITATNLDGQGHGETRGAIDKVGIDQPEDVAKVAVDVYEANESARVVGWNNKIQSTVFNLIPDSITSGVIASARGPPDEK